MDLALRLVASCVCGRNGGGAVGTVALQQEGSEFEPDLVGTQASSHRLAGLMEDSPLSKGVNSRPCGTLVTCPG